MRGRDLRIPAPSAERAQQKRNLGDGRAGLFERSWAI